MLFALLALTSTPALAGDLEQGESIELDLNSRVHILWSTPQSLDLDAGCYDTTIVRGDYLTWAPWGYWGVSGCDSDGGHCRTGWYSAFHTNSPELGLVTHGGGADGGQGFFSTAELAFSNAVDSEFCLTYAQEVPIGIWDGYSGDNYGGISVVVTRRVEDTDGDGIMDDEDSCPDSTFDLSSVIDDDGCTIDDYCDADAVWPNHGAYVSCVAHKTNAFKADGLITGKEKGVIQSAAGRSSVGK